MELKVGMKITLTDSKKYIIIDFLEYNNLKYLFCISTSNKVEPKYLEYKIENGDYQIREEDDPKIIYGLSHKILEEKDKALLEKIEKKIKK